jgi:hypothetical protein
LSAHAVERRARPRRQPWVRAALLVAALYALVGIAFALPATHVRAWRLAAWALSAVAFAAHLAYEHFRLRTAPASAAGHVAFAVALGAFGLAVGANLHAFATHSATQHRHLLLLALGIWPVMTALPAFFVALGVNVVLARGFSRIPPR